ncbi:HAD domain-containing protein [Acidovorax sp.]|uniref:HAD domain-containing protein n=1 Tax=Acidovorax sp. TaxID=1872122 RepID=UPI002ACED5FF|nr:HAD domain-containing protein [Acidovorax sp.]MDZ7865947.1 HAD domain-containing protein [Acidovorax sp.]
MPTLLLDFDEVLHPEFCHESTHFCCLPYFEEAVRLAPEVEIVIASTWRHQHRLEDLARRFSADVSQRVIGVTPHFPALDDVPQTLLSFEREAECNARLRANGRVASPWLALDDRSWLYRPFNRALFSVNGKTGLTAQASGELLQRLLTL